MADRPTPAPDDSLSNQFVQTVSGLFECLGRALICLDREFRVVHASEGLDALTPEGSAALCQRWFGDDRARYWVVVGSTALVEAQLEELGWSAEWISPSDAVMGRL